MYGVNFVTVQKNYPNISDIAFSCCSFLGSGGGGFGVKLNMSSNEVVAGFGGDVATVTLGFTGAKGSENLLFEENEEEGDEEIDMGEGDVETGIAVIGFGFGRVGC